MTKNTQKGSLFDLKITLFFNVLGNFFQQKKGHFLQNWRTKLLTRVIYIYSQKLSATFLWVSKFYDKFGVVVKNFKITAGR